MTDKKLTDEDKGLWFDVARSIKPLWARAIGRGKKKTVMEDEVALEGIEMSVEQNDTPVVIASDVDFVDVMAVDRDAVPREDGSPKKVSRGAKNKKEVSPAQQNMWQNERIDFEKENQVFLEAMGLGERIKSTPVSGVEPQIDPKTESVQRNMDQDVSRDVLREVPHHTELAWIEADHLSRGDKKRIKQGVLKPTRSLDLHGYTVARAEKTIPQFLAQAQRDGHQIVEIITGHGRFKISDEGVEKGILKRLLPTWLAKPLNRHMIKRVMDAPYSRGGAVWVVLRND